MSSVAYGNEIQIFLMSSIVILMLREFFTITANGQGLPQAVKSNDTSGRAALQIYFYLTARPTRCRLAASPLLAEVLLRAIKVFNF